MKTKIVIFLLLITCISIILMTKINFRPNFIDIEIDNVFYKNYFSETVQPENYKKTVEYEEDSELKFPRKIPKKIVLYSNYNFWKSKYELDKIESVKLLALLNDSTKYDWGELGTPEVHYYFKYFDEKNNLIGYTTIDLEGMAYSEPYLGKMKWCRIKNINEIIELINDIEN